MNPHALGLRAVIAIAFAALAPGMAIVALLAGWLSGGTAAFSALAAGDEINSIAGVRAPGAGNFYPAC